MSATEPPALVLHDTPIDEPQARSLVEELQQEYVVRYGGPDETPVDPREFDPPTGVFLVAELGDTLIGCVGLRRHDETTVELKRLFVRPDHRRGGLGRILLFAAERRALELGYSKILLETGTEQPEAVSLYTSTGYRPHENIGHYRHSESSQMYSKTLTPDVPESAAELDEPFG
jgi:GNAT superfamily N-acetyltransferase